MTVQRFWTLLFYKLEGLTARATCPSENCGLASCLHSTHDDKNLCHVAALGVCLSALFEKGDH